MRKIDLEAHFYTEGYIKYLRERKNFPREEVSGNAARVVYSPQIWVPHNHVTEQRLLDIGAGRTAEMDAAGVDIQVLSPSSPGCEPLEAADGTVQSREINDELAEAIKKHPTRFVGLAALAPQDPTQAAYELERAVKQLGFRGTKINSNVTGEYMDDKKYWPVFEAAEQLGVPICLHPTVPAPGILQPYADFGFALAGPALGFAADAALHVMRLIFAGVFDRYPGLKIVLGHLGEGLPFWLNRIDFHWLKPWAGSGEGNRPRTERKPSDYVRDNLIMTTSGMSFMPAFNCTYQALGAARMAFGTDYPYEDTAQSAAFVESALIPREDMERIFHGTAEELFEIAP